MVNQILTLALSLIGGIIGSAIVIVTRRAIYPERMNEQENSDELVARLQCENDQIRADMATVAVNVRTLSYVDRLLTRVQNEKIAELKQLIKDLESTLVICWDNEFPVEDVEALQKRVKEALEEVPDETDIQSAIAGGNSNTEGPLA